MSLQESADSILFAPGTDPIAGSGAAEFVADSWNAIADIICATDAVRGHA